MSTLRPRFARLRLLIVFIFVIATTPIIGLGQTWDGGGDTRNWDDATNWVGDTLPTGDVLFDAAAGTFFDNLNDGDLDLRLGTATSVNSLTFTGDFTQAETGSAATANETHDFTSNDGNVLTIAGANANGHAIELNSPTAAANGFNHFARFNGPLDFTSANASIRNNTTQTSSPNRRIVFNRAVTANDLTLSSASNTGNGSIQFTNNSLPGSSWTNTTIAEGAVQITGGASATNMSLGTGTVTMGTTGDSSLIADPANGGDYTINNDFVVAGNRARLRLGGNSATNETLTVTGNFSSTGAGRLEFDADDNDQLIIQGNLDIDGQLFVNNTNAGAVDSLVRFDGTISGADGGVRFNSDNEGGVGGSGTIIFDLDSTVTSGGVNYGGTAWDIEQSFNIDNFTIDFNLTNGPLTAASYVLIDYSHANGNLSGGNDIFGAISNVPVGYSLDYTTGDQIRLVAVPEPGTACLMAIFGIGFCARRRRAPIA